MSKVVENNNIRIITTDQDIRNLDAKSKEIRTCPCCKTVKQYADVKYFVHHKAELVWWNPATWKIGHEVLQFICHECGCFWEYDNLEEFAIDVVRCDRAMAATQYPEKGRNESGYIFNDLRTLKGKTQP